MKNRRWIRRGIALAVIAGASPIAFAAVPGGLVPVPPVIVISGMPGLGGATTGMLRNDNTMTVNVSSIVPDGSCSTTGIAASGAPLSVPPMGGLATFTASCPSFSTPGIRRCQQHVMNGPMQVANVTIMCVTATGLALTWAGGSALDLEDAVVNTTGNPDMLTINNPSGNPAFDNVSIQLADQDSNFELGFPCAGTGCNLLLTVPPGGAFDLPVMCAPKTVGPHSTMLYVVADNGASLAPVLLTCDGLTDSGMDPAITVDKTDVTLMHPVNSGSASSTVMVSNTGTAGLDISSIQVTGADWASIVPFPCDSLPCSLTTTDILNIEVVFSPTVLGTRNGNLVINSNDPNTSTVIIPLYGTGLGGVLAPDGLGAPPFLDIGSSPVGFPTSATFTLRNDGDVALDPLDLTTSGVFSLGTTSTMIGTFSSETFSVSCTPTAAQVFTSEIIVASPDAVIGSPLHIMVRCTGTNGSFLATPGNVRFDEIRINTAPVRRTVTLVSVGPTLDISSGPTLASSIAGMSVTTATPTTFSPTQPSTFEIEVIPTNDGDLANSISVATMTGGSIDIPVTGKVVTPDVDVPAEVMAGSFCVGQSTMPTTTKLDANGTASIALPTRPVMAAGASSPFQVSYTSPVMYPYQLPAGAKASVEVTPLRQMTPGTRTDALVWATDSPNETAPQTMITASFIADGGAVAPQTVDFGGWPLRMPADSRSIRIQNCGTEPMALLGLTITAQDEFRDDSTEPLPELLQPNQIATLTVGFTPRRVGSRMGTVTIDSSKGPLNVTLLGTGLGDADNTGEAMSFYGCDCATSDPRGAWPALLVIVVLGRRRRR